MTDKPKIELTKEEEDKIVQFWNDNKTNPPNLDSIVGLIFPVADSRSIHGLAVRKFLSTRSIKPAIIKHQKVEKLILTEDEQLFVKNNIATHKIYEIATELFGTEKRVEPLGREVRAINEYLKEIGEKVVKRVDEPTLATGTYVPPTTFFQILALVNLYLHEGLSTQNITAYQRKCLESTLQFLHAPRFAQEINTYTVQAKRISFEAEFIRSVYHKPDLEPEEISLTINVCSDVLEAADLKKQREKLNNILDSVTDDRKVRLA